MPTILDDNSPVDGIKNLATMYFDTTSQWNKNHKQQKEHVSFQTVKGDDWQTAVKELLGGETFKDLPTDSIVKEMIKNDGRIWCAR